MGKLIEHLCESKKTELIDMSNVKAKELIQKILNNQDFLTLTYFEATILRDFLGLDISHLAIYFTENLAGYKELLTDKKT